MANKSRYAKKAQASKKRKAMYSEEVKRIARVRAMTGDPTMTPEQVRSYLNATKNLNTPKDHFDSTLASLRESAGRFDQIKLVAGDEPLMALLKQHTPTAYKNISNANEFLVSIDNDIEEIETTYRPVVDKVNPEQDWTLTYLELQPALDAAGMVQENLINNTEVLMENIRLIVTMSMTDDAEILNQAGVK